jgi:DNA-binding CsgD family transcriptional regulator
LRLLVEVAAAHLAFDAGEAPSVDLPASSVPTFWPGLHEIAGLQHAAAGEVEAAAAELRQATSAWSTSGMPRWAVRSAAATAAVLGRAGARGGTHLSDAVDLARRHGLVGALRRMGAPVVSGLTSREEAVLRCVGRGLTTPQIAVELAISPATVDQHVESGCRKLNAATRLEAASMVALA